MEALNDNQTKLPLAEDPRWARIAARDKTADGQFWYSVSTTGVYCRPSCPSRLANPKNVQLHTTLESARATGFRACKRCKPEGLPAGAENAAIVAKACRIIEGSEEEPSLDDLARSVGRSPSYFHRVFKAATGLTPKDYASAHRANKVRDGLGSGITVTEAIYDAGFNSSGRFYEKSTGMLGMTPTQYRAGGADEEIRFAVGQTTLGAILVASSKKGVVSILLGSDPGIWSGICRTGFPRQHCLGRIATMKVWWPGWWASSNVQRSVLTCLWMSAEPSFNNGYGKLFRKSLPEKRSPMPRLPGVSRHPRHHGLLPGLVLPTSSQWQSPATVWFEPAVHFPATHGVWSASAISSRGRNGHEKDCRQRGSSGCFGDLFRGSGCRL